MKAAMRLRRSCKASRVTASTGEKVLLLKIAESKPEWQNARLAQILALNTTMRGCEIKGLRWRDVDLIDRTLTVVRVTTKTDRASASFLSMRTRQELS